MTFTRLLLENLFYHRRGNLAVLLGVVVGTAVLTGALLVGDSLRGSLRDLSDQQLGWVDAALVAPRFFRQELADQLPAGHASPALILPTVASLGVNGKPADVSVPKTLLLGVDARFWSGQDKVAINPGGMAPDFWSAKDADNSGVVLSAALARDLGAQAGDKVSFSLERVSGAPRETIMGRRSSEDVVTTFTFPVVAVLPVDHFGSRFTLNPTPALPRNAFVPLAWLQDRLYDQQREKKTYKRFPRHPVNTVLLQGADTKNTANVLKEKMTLLDWGLELRQPVTKFAIPAPGYLSLESREMFLPAAVQQAVKETGLRSAPTLVYLVNNMAGLRHDYGAMGILLSPPSATDILRAPLQEFAPRQVPYCIVAALDPTLDPPLGRFLPKNLTRLADDEILLVDWEGSPLKQLKPDMDYVTLTYYDPDQEGQFREKTSIFRVAGHVPIQGPTNDLYLTPEFPGITDSRTLTQIGGWDPPFPFKRWLVGPTDEKYWSEHRTTPKAYITLARGKEIWGSRFGDVTSIRIVPGGKSKQEIEELILAHLDPKQGGYRVEDMRAAAQKASTGSVEFGMYFLGFSFFLIVAALLLIGLLFRLNLDRRASELGLLLAVGWRRWTVRWLLLAEGVLLAVIGGVIGLLAAVGYARLLLDFLAASWPGGLDRTLFLHLHIGPMSLLIGYGAALFVSVLTIFWTTRLLGRVSPRALLAGAAATDSASKSRRRWISLGLIMVGVLGAIGCFILGTQTQDHEMQAGSFLGSGALLLTAGLAGLWLWLHRREGQAVVRRGLAGLLLLGMRNAGRHPVRSLLTAGLLASATFLIVAVQAFHRDPSQDFLAFRGGSGGFPFLAETELPVFEDLNQKKLSDAPGLDQKDMKLVRDAKFYPLRVRQGDDVSCLNLYRPREPQILGVPQVLIQRGGFQFAGLLEPSDAEKANPWLLLNRAPKSGAIPVMGEANAVTHILNSSLGGKISATDGAGNAIELQIVGLLQDSVFQSELLMSEKIFQKLYPRQEGHRFFLIQPGAESHVSDAEIKKTVARWLTHYGVTVASSRERLATYLAVENTYLATFQALGGLGLLLGALGLAVVLLRGVWERRGELALLRALGFRRSALGWLVLAENSYLLLAGLSIGTVAAMLSVAPHVTGSAAVPWLQLVGLLLLVLVTGLLAGLAAVAATLRAPLLMALRKE
jgi:ABC-type antimicrobial peptide transport system permease subunit